MKLPSLFFLPTLLAVFLLVAPAALSAKVLLPGENTKTEGNLGLVPTPTPDGEKKDSPLAQTPIPAVPNVSPAESLALTPGGAVSQKAIEEQNKLTAHQLINKSLARTKESQKGTAARQKMQKLLEDMEKAKERDSKILEDIFSKERPKDPSLKASFSVAISNQYMWGEKEIGSVKAYLGYSANDISQNCQMRFRVRVQTEKEQHRFSEVIPAGEERKIPYEEGSQVLSVAFTPQAVCKESEQLPRNGGLLFRVKDGLIATYLSGSKSCNVSPDITNPSRLVMQYLGDGDVKCQFQ